MDFEKLMRLSEAAMGFSGGPEVDEYPHLGLVECCAAATSCIYESQIEMFESISETNDQALDLTAKMLTEGAIDASAMEALAEASVKGIIAKAQSLFDRLITFFKSMIAKLTTLIDSWVANGKNLVKKYGNAVTNLSTEAKAAATKDYKGYRNLFNEKIKFNSIDKTDKDIIEGLVTSVFGSELKFTEAAASDEAKLDAAIEKFDNMTSSDAKAKMAEKISGITGLSGDSWKKDLRTKVWGEQGTLVYGQDYNETILMKILQDPADCKKIRESYKNLIKAAEDYKKALKTVESEFNSSHKDDKSTSTSKISSYYNKYIKAVSDAFGCVNDIKGMHTSFENDKNKQARALFTKMMVKGKVVAEKAKKEEAPKAENNSIEMDEFFLDFDD